jgi:hypothetical protein
MRTTVRLDPHLLIQAKRRAAEQGRTLTSLLEEALGESLSRRAAQGSARPVRLKTVKGGVLRPGVDLDDSASLLERMDS